METYTNNIQALNILPLERINKESNIDKQNSLQIFKSKNNLDTATYNNKSIHSKYNPTNESIQILNDLKEDSFDAIILFEMGLGHVVQAVSEEYPNIPMIIIQLDKQLFQSLLLTFNYTNIKALHYSNIYINPSIQSMIQQLYAQGIVNPKIITTQAAKSIYPQDSLNLYTKELTNYSKKMQINRNTLKKFKNRWTCNILNNVLSHEHSIHSLNSLSKVFSKFPILLCGGGPSLESIKSVSEIKNKMPIVCVDTALPVLQKFNIVPDFIITVDPQYINSQHLNWCLSWAISQNASLIMDITASSRVLHMLPKKSKIFLTYNNEMSLVYHLLKNTNFNSHLESGGSVANTAWEVCRILGSNNIYTIGLDLSYENTKTYSQGTLTNQMHYLNAHKLQSQENTSIQNYYSINNKMLHENLGNNTSVTSPQLIEYAKWFEKKFQETPNITTSSISPISIKIQGLEYTPIVEISQLENIRDSIEQRKQKINFHKLGNHVTIQNNLNDIVNHWTNTLHQLEYYHKNLNNNIIENSVISINHILKDSLYIDIAQFLFPETIPKSLPMQYLNNSYKWMTIINIKLNYMIFSFEKLIALFNTFNLSKNDLSNTTTEYYTTELAIKEYV